MDTPAARIADRYLRGDALINLTPIPVVLADGVVSAADLERAVGRHDIEAHDVRLYRLPGDEPTVYRWRGHCRNGTSVSGQLVLRVTHDSKHVVVFGEIALPARYVASQEGPEEGVTTEPILPMKQRLLLVRSIARRAIEDLRSNPTDIAVVLSHLSDIAEITEQRGWAVD